MANGSGEEYAGFVMLKRWFTFMLLMGMGFAFLPLVSEAEGCKSEGRSSAECIVEAPVGRPLHSVRSLCESSVSI